MGHVEWVENDVCFIETINYQLPETDRIVIEINGSVQGCFNHLENAENPAGFPPVACG